MNKSRTDFQMPTDHEIKVTPYWFLGFFEGEGSVFVFKKNYTLGISISQSLIDSATILKIAEFLEQLAGADEREGESIVKVYSSKKEAH